MQAFCYGDTGQYTWSIKFSYVFVQSDTAFMARAATEHFALRLQGFHNQPLPAEKTKRNRNEKIGTVKLRLDVWITCYELLYNTVTR